MTVHPIPIQAGEDVVRIGRALVHRATLAGATAALLLAPLPMPLLAKAPGVSHCYKGVCHRVRTVGQTRAIVGRTQTIETSYYDIPGVDRFNTGTFTSNGERFDANDGARVASADLPDGTELLLRNPVNGRVSHVLVNDFGPFRGDRRLDVTRRVAEDLDFVHKGVVKLEVTVIAPPQYDDLTYRRNRQRRPTKGHLGVLFDGELPALLASLVAERRAPAEAEEIGVASTLQPAAEVALVAQPSAGMHSPPIEPDLSAAAEADRAVFNAQAETAQSPQTPEEVAPVVPVLIAGLADGSPAPARVAAEEVQASRPTVAPSVIVVAATAGAQEEGLAHSFAPALIDSAHAAPAGNGTASWRQPASNSLLLTLLALLSLALLLPAMRNRTSSRARASNPRRGSPEDSLPVDALPQLAARDEYEAAVTIRPATSPAVIPQPVPAIAAHDDPMPAATGAPATSLAPPALRTSTPVAARGSLIDADIMIEGTLRSAGRVSLAGIFKGRIEADEIIVLPGGRLDGEAVCRQAEISGELRGSITAFLLQVRATGRVAADVNVTRIGIDLGGQVEGDVRRVAST